MYIAPKVPLSFLNTLDARGADDISAAYSTLLNRANTTTSEQTRKRSLTYARRCREELEARGLCLYGPYPDNRDRAIYHWQHKPGTPS